MKILVIGGTQFIGYHLSLEFINSGHEITVFHKNEASRSKLPGIQHINGDRLLNVAKQLSGNFDLLIDTCAFEPSDLNGLSGINFNKYLLVSTVAVYGPDIPEGQTEVQKEFLWMTQD